MSKGRLEAFSDGVFAVLITILVLDLKVPHGGDLQALREVLPVFLSYVLSFIFIGIYWNNHHHLLHTMTRVNGSILWANLHLLFWLSLVPFITSWMGEHQFDAVPTAVYGGVLFFAAVAFTILVKAIISEQGPDSALKKAVGNDFKGNLSLLIYVAAIALAFFVRGVSQALYIFVALIWLIPDRRIEKRLVKE